MVPTLWSEQFRDAEPVRMAGREAFEAAVAAFAGQFDAPLTGGATDGYVVGFYTTPAEPGECVLYLFGPDADRCAKQRPTPGRAVP
jgi:hypothetical protein